MCKYSFVCAFFCLVLLIACDETPKQKSNSETNSIYEPIKYADTTARPTYQNSSSVKKYLIVMIKTDEPRIETQKFETPTTIDRETGGVIPPAVHPGQTTYYKETTSQYFLYTSDVIEIDDYDEDKRYREIDRYEEEKVRPALNEAARRIEYENSIPGGTPSNANAKVISKESKVFDTYREASQYRDKVRNNQ